MPGDRVIHGASRDLQQFPSQQGPGRPGISLSLTLFLSPYIYICIYLCAHKNIYVYIYIYVYTCICIISGLPHKVCRMVTHGVRSKVL